MYQHVYLLLTTSGGIGRNAFPLAGRVVGGEAQAQVMQSLRPTTSGARELN
jgi:hypothetical protein